MTAGTEKFKPDQYKKAEKTALLFFLKIFSKVFSRKCRKEWYQGGIMNKIKNTLKRLWQDESGQGATEYILILVVVVAIVMVFRKKIVEAIGNRTGEVGEKLKSAISNDLI